MTDPGIGNIINNRKKGLLHIDIHDVFTLLLILVALITLFLL